MKQTHRAFRPVRSLLAAALAFAALPAAAQTYTQTVFFGDSLTDSGWYRPALVQVGGPSAAILGRFTTNPTLVWSEYLADYYGTNAASAQPGRHQLGRRRRAHGHRRRKRARRDPVAQHADHPLSRPPPAASPIRARCTRCGAARTTCSRSPVAHPRRPRWPRPSVRRSATSAR